MKQETTAVSPQNINVITPTSFIDTSNGLTVTSPSRDNTGLAAATSTTSSRQPTHTSIQFTDAPAHLDSGAIGGIVGGILGGLLVILSITFCIQFTFRQGMSPKWNVFKRESKVGGRTVFEDDDRIRINGEDNRLSGRPRESEFEIANGRLEKDGGEYSTGGSCIIKTECQIDHAPKKDINTVPLSN